MSRLATRKKDAPPLRTPSPVSKQFQTSLFRVDSRGSLSYHPRGGDDDAPPTRFVDLRTVTAVAADGADVVLDRAELSPIRMRARDTRDARRWAKTLGGELARVGDDAPPSAKKYLTDVFGREPEAVPELVPADDDDDEQAVPFCGINVWGCFDALYAARGSSSDRIAATPRPGRGSSSDESRRRRGRDADSPWRPARALRSFDAPKSEIVSESEEATRELDGADAHGDVGGSTTTRGGSRTRGNVFDAVERPSCPSRPRAPVVVLLLYGILWAPGARDILTYSVDGIC